MRVVTGRIHQFFAAGLLLLTACGPAAAPPAGGGALPALSSLPAGPARQAAALQTLAGDAAVLTSDGVTLGGGTAQLDSTAGELQWAIYRFDASADQTLVNIEVDAGTGSEYWVAVSDYGRNHWRHLGLHELQSNHAFDDPAGTFSSGPFLYVAILAWDGQSTTLNSITVDLDGGSAVLSRVERFGAEPGVEFIVAASRQVLPGQGPVAVAMNHDGTALSHHRPLLIRYDAAGAVADATLLTLADPLYTGFQPTTLATTDDGSFFVGGSAFSGDGTEFIILKLDADLTPAWAFTYDPGVECYGEIVSRGQGVLAGLNFGSNTGFILAIDSAGSVEWSRELTGGVIFDLGWHPGEGCYVTGHHSNLTNFLLRLDAAGSPIFVRDWVAGNINDLHANHPGSGVLVGCADAPGGDLSNFNLLEFSADGNVTGQFGYQAPPAEKHAFAGLNRDAAGNILFGILSFGAADQAEALGVVRLAPDGALLSSQHLAYPFWLAENHDGLTPGADGRVYLAGRILNDSVGTPALTNNGGSVFTPALAVTPGTLDLTNAGVTRVPVTFSVDPYQGDGTAQDADTVLVTLDY
jgi:hypothetical protein